jgi:hypothetical protein
VTSSKDRWIGAYANGLTIVGKLSCPNNNKKKRERETCIGNDINLKTYFVNLISAS